MRGFCEWQVYDSVISLKRPRICTSGHGKVHAPAHRRRHIFFFIVLQVRHHNGHDTHTLLRFALFTFTIVRHRSWYIVSSAFPERSIKLLRPIQGSQRFVTLLLQWFYADDRRSEVIIAEGVFCIVIRRCRGEVAPRIVFKLIRSRFCFSSFPGLRWSI